MSQTLTIEVPDAFAEAWRKLPPEQQFPVIDYTSRLAAEEDQRQEAAADAEWDHLFSDPVKMTNFRRWAEESRARSTPQPFDESWL